jgi:signal transduction histidine kinase
MSLPITVAGTLHAIITVASTKEHAFTEDDLVQVERLTRESSGPLYLLMVINREREASLRLQQLDQLKSDFVGMVAHDLRSPMTVISGFADFLRTHLETISADETRLYLGRISDNTKLLSAFIEDVLQVARIEAGELRIDLTEFDLGDLIRTTVEELTIANPHRRITLNVQRDLSLALGDRGRQWQIINNLVTNALKFSGNTTEPIEISAMAKDQCIEVAVTDHGIGIGDEDLPRIFDKFYRVDHTSERSTASGTGLGLYICKSLVEAQNGAIRVRSEVDHGTTFTYTVPTASAIQISDQEAGTVA